jgi:2,4-dienoyl-CoA reductase-like NADH-dependent reductase (Old Yellow Enzyme family)/thioredoxin reductase
VTSDYARVLSPVRIGPVEVRNRLYMSAHGLPLVAGGPHGSMVPSDDYAFYFEERARGGVGLIFHSMSAFPRDWLSCPRYAESVPSFRAVAEHVHRHGAKLFAQLCYYHGHGPPWEPLSPMAPVLAPSAFQRWETHDTCRAMTQADITKMTELFGACARNLAEAGYDGVEIHASHGVLLQHFLSPYFNRRDDAYGGTFDNRMRFAVELLAAVRAGIGPDRALGIRLNVDELLPGGMTSVDARAIVTELTARGLVDFVDMDVAVEPQQAPLMTTSQFVEPGFYGEFARKVAPAVQAPAVAIGVGGRVTTLAQAEAILADGVYALVGAARGLIAEPDLIKNTVEGRADRNRHCIAFNTCIGGGPKAGTNPSGWGCVLNPASGRERRWGVDRLAPAPEHMRVTVVGAGPAGLEAARVAALRGHRVTVLEQLSDVGGQLRPWASLRGREAMLTAIDWFYRRVTELDVDLRLGVVADLDSVMATTPDAVLIATGSAYDRTGETGFSIAPIPGSDAPHVYSVEDVLLAGARPGGRVVVLDGEGMHTGIGIAELLAEGGAEVELVTREAEPLSTLQLSMEADYLIPRLYALGGRIRTYTFVRRIGEHSVTLYDVRTGIEEESAAAAVVLATMRKPLGSELAAALESRVRQVYQIGDAAAPRGLFVATYEGQRFARLVGEDAAPRTTTEALFAPLSDDAFPRPAAVLAGTSDGGGA